MPTGDHACVATDLDRGQTERWERFLASHPLGQYQQSVRWARVKQGDGWSARLKTWTSGHELAGGFLMLVKKTRLGRLGFVNKGPVLREETPEFINEALNRLVRTAQEEQLRGLIVQPPDFSKIRREHLHRHGFSLRAVPGIIDATLIASLEGGAEAIYKRLGSTARNEARRAMERGVRVVEGDQADLPVFFDLMCQSCVRQKVRPNPSSVQALRLRWEAFGHDIKLLFADVGNERIAGLLLLRFADRCTFEKKGWNEKYPKCFPNTLLYVEAMRKAAEWGCRSADFGAMDRSLAERILKEGTAPGELAATRHSFHYRLGGMPVLLPPAQIRVWPRFLTGCMDFCLAWPRLSRWLGHRVGG